MEVIEEKVEAGGERIERSCEETPKPTKSLIWFRVAEEPEQTGAKRKATAKSRSKQKHLQRSA